ncbi:MAG: EamA family transporter, partial [Nostocoides sp.]
MPTRHAIAAALVMTIWGVNFVVIDKGLAGVPPLLFVAIRFSVVLLALPFIPRPDVPWRHLALVGGFMSVGQFGFLYSGLALGMPPGLASLVLQTQAVVTVLLAVVVLRERPAGKQVAGMALGVAGLVVVAVGRGGQVPTVGLVLTVLGATSWALGNITVRRLGLRSGLGVTVWSAAVVPLPMVGLSLLLDGPSTVGHALTNLTPTNWLSTAYTAGLASIVGFTVWNTLLARHCAASVAPWSLLVPP